MLETSEANINYNIIGNNKCECFKNSISIGQSAVIFKVMQGFNYPVLEYNSTTTCERYILIDGNEE